MNQKLVYVLIELPIESMNIKIKGVYTSYEIARINCTINQIIKGPFCLCENIEYSSDEELYNACRGPMYTPFGDSLYK